MNYCQKIHYNIFQADQADFDTLVDRLLDCIPQNEIVLRLVFFGKPLSNAQYLERRLSIRKKVRYRYQHSEPALTYVAQPPLGAALIMEVHSYIPDGSDCIAFRHYEGTPYVMVENDKMKCLYAGGFQEDILMFGIQQQAAGVFARLGDVLRKEGFPINSIVRQWNYIERITDCDGADQRYQMFNNARSEFYKPVDWSNGYPAATGIGADLGGLVVDVDAVVFKQDDCYATPIDNKLQIAAHAYSEKVLEKAGVQKTTPKFERAKRLTTGNNSLIYISGTAAIRGEETLVGVGLERQLRITMENIAELIGDAAIKFLRVYLKDRSYYEEAKSLLETYHLNVPISYMCADVCREELLIEIEGIAMK